METIEKVGEIIRWYKETARPKGWNTTQLDYMSFVAARLSARLYELADLTGQAFEAANTAKYLRDSEQDRLKWNRIDEEIKRGNKVNVSQIEIEVSVKIDHLKKARVEAESFYERLKTLLTSARDVLQQLRQDISNLKIEREQEFKGTGSQNMPTK